jgi:ABC-2 type transport system ATP-binding protein
MTATAVVEIRELTVRYGRTTAVDGLDLEVEEGSVYALLGRNGSGKSSTVRCLLGQRRASAGELRLFGLDAWRERRRLMERVGVVPEHPDMPPQATPESLAGFMARVEPRWRDDVFRDRLAFFRVPMTTRCGRLSKGQLRQTALALALACSPELLVLDDPTLGLDAVARRELFEELISELADRGSTVLLTTHDLAGVEGIADRVGVLDQGRLVVDEELERLKQRFRRLVWARDREPEAEALEAGLREVGVVASRLAAVAGEAVVSGWSEHSWARFQQRSPVEQLRVETLSLEEIFVALCGGSAGGR